MISSLCKRVCLAAASIFLYVYVYFIGLKEKKMNGMNIATESKRIENLIVNK